jgi:leucyl/phenylalanyl-tRNA--protein transferase
MPGPIEPAPTAWSLSAAPDDHPHDAWARGADLEPGTLLTAYRAGLFPMREGDGDLIWWSPTQRAIVPLEGFHASRSLRRARGRFEIRVDTAFRDVISACADPTRPHGWIDESFIAAYTRLHELGWVHSVETWDADGLAGGLYGVAIGGLFAAESMFFRRRDASKVALWALVELLRQAPDAHRRLLDAQWLTPHLSSLGGIEVPRASYRARLADALLASGIPWDATPAPVP